MSINRKRKLGTNSKESPDWFHIAPEWKGSQFREYLAKNEDSIKILSKHKGWISISTKTNNRKTPLEKFTFDKEKHRNIMPNWMNLNYYKNYTKDEDIFNKEIDFLKKEKLTIGQCYELYNLMGGDEKEEMKGIKVKKIEEIEDDNIEEGEDDDRFVRHRKDNKKPKQKKQRKNYT